MIKAALMMGRRGPSGAVLAIFSLTNVGVVISVYSLCDDRRGRRKVLVI